MKKITIRSQLLDVATRWQEQYCKELVDENYKIYIALKTLDLTKATPKDVENIIGNDSWVCAIYCDVCQEYYKKVIEFGGAITYTICKKCLKKALKLLK